MEYCLITLPEGVDKPTDFKLISGHFTKESTDATDLIPEIACGVGVLPLHLKISEGKRPP